MNAGEKMDDIKDRVLHSARELFIKQGYKKTTIRQIVDKSGVLIGSIYYFFENKEDIFKSIIIDIFDFGDKYAAEKLVYDANPVYRYAVTCVLELIAVDLDERICELYYEAYSSNIILDSLVKHAAKRSQEIFEPYNPNYAYEDYYRQTLAIKGVMRNFIAGNLMGSNITLEEKTNSFLDISLNAFNVPSQEIVKIKKRLFKNLDEIKLSTIELIKESIPDEKTAYAIIKSNSLL